MQFKKFMGGGQASPVHNYEAPELSIVEIAVEKGFAVSDPYSTNEGWGDEDNVIEW